MAVAVTVAAAMTAVAMTAVAACGGSERDAIEGSRDGLEFYHEIGC